MMHNLKEYLEIIAYALCIIVTGFYMVKFLTKEIAYNQRKKAKKEELFGQDTEPKQDEVLFIMTDEQGTFHQKLYNASNNGFEVKGNHTVFYNAKDDKIYFTVLLIKHDY